MARTRLYPPSVDPGFPELPETPSGWRQTTFGEVLEVVERALKLEPDKTYRLVNAKRNRGGIALRGELPGREILTKTQFEAKRGDFLISRRQIIHGACGVIPDELDGAVVSNEYSTLRPRPDLSLDFLRQYTHTPYFQRTCFHSSHGVDVEKMIFKISEWLERRVDLPPLGEQKKIAAILSSVDDVIESTQAVIDQLGVLKKSMMAELLTRGMPGRHTEFKETEIGELPASWTLLTANELLASGPSNGRSPPSKQVPPGVPTFSIGAVRDGVVNIEDNLKYADVDLTDVTQVLVRLGDILIVRGNGNPELVGRCGIVEAAPENCIYPDIVMRVRPDKRMLPAFFVAIWNCDLVHGQVLDKAKTTNGTYKINGQDVRSILLPVPPIDEQAAIAAAIESVNAYKRTTINELVALQQLKSSLMSVLLTGEVRVKPDEVTR